MLLKNIESSLAIEAKHSANDIRLHLSSDIPRTKNFEKIHSSKIESNF